MDAIADTISRQLHLQTSWRQWRIQHFQGGGGIERPAIYIFRKLSSRRADGVSK